MAKVFIFQSRVDIYYGIRVIGRLTKPNLWRLSLNMRFYQTKISLIPRKALLKTIAATVSPPPPMFCVADTPNA